MEPEIPTDPIVERLNLVENENEYLKEKFERIEEEKMELELHVADVIDDHKIKMEKMRLMIRKIRKYAMTVRLGIIMLLDQLLPYLRS